MARAAKLAIVLASVLGSSLVSPVESQAGVIPWVYDAIFGPPGSMQANRTYAPMAVGYAPYRAAYTPVTVAYAPIDGSYGSVSEPMYTSYAPSYSGVTTVGYRSFEPGCACNQSSGYVPSTTYGASYGYAPSYYGSSGCSSCGSCSSGNCSAGSGCSNCTVNSAPTTAGYGSTGVTGPIPDPNGVSRDERSRLYDLERKLDELEQRQKYDERYFRRQNPDYSPEIPRANRDEREEEVKARRLEKTFGSDPESNPDNFPTPVKRGPAPSNSNEENPEERFKPSLPPTTDDKPAAEKADGTTQVKETEPQALNMESRMTAKAVTPRVRLQIRTKQSGTALAKTAKPAVKTSGTSQPVSVARQ